MIDDRRPQWGRGFHVSSQDLADLHRHWADVGRQVWDAGTRAGRDVAARTEQELEALGRAHQRTLEEARSKARQVQGDHRADDPLSH